MSWLSQLRRGQGPIWGRLKRIARAVLALHIPVAGPTRLLFRLAYRLHVSVRELLLWALRFFWYEPLFRSQCASVGAAFQMEALPYMQGTGRVVIGNRVRLSGKSTIGFSPRASAPPELIVGDGSFIGHQCAFSVARSVRIGANCLLAGGVRVFDMDGHPLDATARRRGEPTPEAGIRPVVIGDDVWIGAGAIILKGVVLGDRSIVAAGAVVTRSVPADSVVAGNPAQVVRTLAADAAEATPERDRWLTLTDGVTHA